MLIKGYSLQLVDPLRWHTLKSCVEGVLGSQQNLYKFVL